MTYGSVSDFFGSLPEANLSNWAGQVSNEIKNSVSASSLEYLYKIQYDLLQKGVPDAETIIGSTVAYGLGVTDFLGAAMWLLMPFSRGNVHIGSADPLAYPLINPNYFLVDFDLRIQVAIAKWTRKFYETEPIRSFVTEISPGFELVPHNATDAQWGNWIKSSGELFSNPRRRS